MARTTDEWVGKDDDTKIPERVRQRIRSKFEDVCASCKLRVAFGGQIDHVVALKNWTGASGLAHGNRESNLQLLCRSCHTAKTGRDVAEKAKTYKKQKAYGSLKKEPSALSKKWQWAKALKAKRREERDQDSERSGLPDGRPEVPDAQE